MTEIEEPDPRWRAIIGDAVDGIEQRIGATGHGLMGVITAAIAYHSYQTGMVGAGFEHVIGVDGWLFLLGFIAGGSFMAAANLYVEDGDRS